MFENFEDKVEAEVEYAKQEAVGDGYDVGDDWTERHFYKNGTDYTEYTNGCEKVVVIWGDTTVVVAYDGNEDAVYDFAF